MNKKTIKPQIILDRFMSYQPYPRWFPNFLVNDTTLIDKCVKETLGIDDSKKFKDKFINLPKKEYILTYARNCGKSTVNKELFNYIFEKLRIEDESHSLPPKSSKLLGFNTKYIIFDSYAYHPKKGV